MGGTVNDAIITNKGDCLSLTATWRDKFGNVFDLTNYTVVVTDALPASLTNAVVTVDDPTTGVFKVFADSSITDDFALGRRNYMRLGVVSADGCRDVTPRIWIEVV